MVWYIERFENGRMENQVRLVGLKFRSRHLWGIEAVPCDASTVAEEAESRSSHSALLPLSVTRLCPELEGVDEPPRQHIRMPKLLIGSGLLLRPSELVDSPPTGENF